jgi:hypothetical protein
MSDKYKALKPLHLDLKNDGNVVTINRGETFDLPDHFDAERLMGLAIKEGEKDTRILAPAGYEHLDDHSSATERVQREEEERAKIDPAEDPSFKKLVVLEKTIRDRNEASIAASGAETAEVERKEAEKRAADAKASKDKAAIAETKADVVETKTVEKDAKAKAKETRAAADNSTSELITENQG